VPNLQSFHSDKNKKASPNGKAFYNFEH